MVGAVALLSAAPSVVSGGLSTLSTPAQLEYHVASVRVASSPVPKLNLPATAVPESGFHAAFPAPQTTDGPAIGAAAWSSPVMLNTDLRRPVVEPPPPFAAASAAARNDQRGEADAVAVPLPAYGALGVAGIGLALSYLGAKWLRLRR